jgi:hypothetical protein
LEKITENLSTFMKQSSVTHDASTSRQGATTPPVKWNDDSDSAQSYSGMGTAPCTYSNHIQYYYIPVYNVHPVHFNHYYGIQYYGLQLLANVACSIAKPTPERIADALKTHLNK